MVGLHYLRSYDCLAYGPETPLATFANDEDEGYDDQNDKVVENCRGDRQVEAPILC